MNNKAAAGDPVVTVIIPVFNEERYIASCLDSVMGQTYDKAAMEVLILDGMSTDDTRKIVGEYAREYPYIRLIENPTRTAPTALNRGIEAAKGSYIIRLDAHARYADDYISKCVETLESSDASNVGGPITTLPGADTAMAEAIAIATSHAFGVGNSYFRTSQETRYVDTVPFGAFKKDVFKKVGLFNRHLIRNQDIELNGRIRKNGMKILLSPEIRSFYYNRPTLAGLWRQNFANGMWNILTPAVSGTPLSIRHYVPLIFVLSLVLGIIFSQVHLAGAVFFAAVAISYLAANLFFSFKLGIKKRAALIPFISAAFTALHFSYGLGSMWGLIKVKSWKRGLVNDDTLGERDNEVDICKF
ncbi:MAG: glycosyltransferase family 2 protein [Thermodesulfobacteriota bacterium]